MQQQWHCVENSGEKNQFGSWTGKCLLAKNIGFRKYPKCHSLHFPSAQAVAFQLPWTKEVCGMGTWLMNSFPQDIQWRVSMGMAEPCAYLLFSLLALLQDTLWEWCAGDNTSTGSGKAVVPSDCSCLWGSKTGARTLVWLLMGFVVLYKTSSMSEICMWQKSGCQRGDLQRDGAGLCSFAVVLQPGVCWHAQGQQLPWCMKMGTFALKHNEQFEFWIFFLLSKFFNHALSPLCLHAELSTGPERGSLFPSLLHCSETCPVACTPLTLHNTNISLSSVSSWQDWVPFYNLVKY